MALTKEQVIERLKQVNDPELHRDIVSLNMLKDVTVCDGNVLVKIELTTPACPLKDQIQNDVKAAVQELPGAGQVNVEFTANVQQSPQQKAFENNPLPGVKNIVAVGAGKGGVGKSTVAVNLAIGLARSGASVGLLDGDIYGPSLPTMLGLHDMNAKTSGENMIEPFNVHGIKCMTIGRLVEDDKPLIWRGPMAHGAFRQLATQTNWGELDYLIIDLPPGTGDVPLTMSQILPLSGAIVVCTPQRVAQDDARRAVRMFEQLSVDVLGIVENMSYFVCNHGEEHDIFGRGGAENMATEMGVNFLGSVPITMALRENCDSGDPTANFEGDEKLAEPLTAIAERVAARLSVMAAEGQGSQPSLSIS